jgi:NAD(P)-dependent dehydrogenase (short-subunit alcohol dehydrogenase family)
MSSEQSRIALVTGGNRGIGYAVTAGLARRGYTVYLGARDHRSGETSATTLRDQGLDVSTVQLDVTDPDSIERAAKHLDQDARRLDLLVNNAGIAGDREEQIPGKADVAAIRAVFETNVFGTIAVTEAMLPLLRRSTGARVVNVSSSVGSLSMMSDPNDYFASLPGWLGYPVSKSALNQITVQYAKQLRPEGIFVDAADPGAVATSPTAKARGITRTPDDGARIIIDLACTEDSQTGRYWRDAGAVAW